MLRACGISDSDTLLVALSGGADSTALLLALCELREAGAGPMVCAAHLHHGIRGDAADADMRFCESLCERLRVPFVSERADVPAYAAAHGRSIETAARELRYEFLSRAMAQCGASCMVTAHHRDDQAETVLQHLLRGAGTNGLSGMRARAGDVARPLLAKSRAEIEAYLSERGQPWRTDETNALDDAARNRVRHTLLPLLERLAPGAAESLAKTARLAGEDDAYLTELALEKANAAAQGDGYDRKAIAALPKPLCARVLRALLKRSSDDVSEADIERVRALLTAQTGTRIELSGGRAAWVDSKAVYAGHYPKPVAYETPFCREGETQLPGGTLLSETVLSWRRPEHANELFMDAQKLPTGAVVRTRRDGDRFFPLGAPGTRLLSDVLTDRKIPRERRDMPLIACGNEIYCVFGVTVSALVAIGPETRHILHIVLREERER